MTPIKADTPKSKITQAGVWPRLRLNNIQMSI
jgi:hypothetical protein